MSEPTLSEMLMEIRLNHQETLNFREHIREELTAIKAQVTSTNGRVTALEHERTRREALGWKQLAAAVGFIGVIAGIINVAVNLAT